MMWKLIDCGSYPWFVMEKQKYFHCVYGVTGEYKKIAVKISQKSMRSLSDKFYLAYLKSWPLGTASCRLDKTSAKFYTQLWKGKTKTKLMREILKQLKATNNGKRTN